MLMANSNDMLTTQQFAEKASVSASTVSKWLREGKIEGVKKGRKWMISADQLAGLTSSGDQAKSTEPAAAASAAAPAKAGPKGGYTVKQFSEITYLTPFGVELYLKEGRLRGTRESSGEWVVDAANLEKGDIKHLLR
jgi:excisionase family DNA binding protein